MDMTKAPLFCIIGKSGSGKTTICNMLEKTLKLNQIPSYTTRKPRYENEKGHTFVSDSEFDKLEDIIAYAETDGNRYAVTKSMLEDESYSLYVVDMTGWKMLQTDYVNKYENTRPLISIYIDCDVVDRFNYMVNRQDTQAGLIPRALKRIEHDAVEFNQFDIENWIDVVVKNDTNIEDLYNKVEQIMHNHFDRYHDAVIAPYVYYDIYDAKLKEILYND